MLSVNTELKVLETEIEGEGKVKKGGRYDTTAEALQAVAMRSETIGDETIKLWLSVTVASDTRSVARFSV